MKGLDERQTSDRDRQRNHGKGEKMKGRCEIQVGNNEEGKDERSVLICTIRYG